MKFSILGMTQATLKHLLVLFPFSCLVAAILLVVMLFVGSWLEGASHEPELKGSLIFLVFMFAIYSSFLPYLFCITLIKTLKLRSYLAYTTLGAICALYVVYFWQQQFTPKDNFWLFLKELPIFLFFPIIGALSGLCYWVFEKYGSIAIIKRTRKQGKKL